MSDTGGSSNDSVPGQEPPVLDMVQCLKCGAAVEARAGLSRCWLCGTTLPDFTSSASSNPFEPTAIPPNPGSVSASKVYDTLMMGILVAIVILTILVAVGIGLSDPGMLVIFLILTVPPFIIVGAQGGTQIMKDGKARPGSLVLTWLLSTMAAIGIAALLAVAAVIMLVVYCFYAIAQGGP